MFENEQKHESYGMLQFCRSSGGNSPLFGTSVQHGDRIRMYLRHGAVGRNLNNDFYFAEGEIASVEMSYAQFAEAITAMNVGSGVPVTIKYLNGEKMADCPFIDKRKQFEDEFAAKNSKINENVNSLISDVEALLSEKKSLTKKDRDELLSKLFMLKQDIGTNTEFTYKQFNEQMNKTVAEAKGEIELFFQNKVNSFASMGLVEQGEINPISLLGSGNNATEND